MAEAVAEPVEVEGKLVLDDRSIHQRMIAVLAAMPAIGKNQRNQQQNFMFRGHDDVLNALNPLLAEHGVFIVPDVLERIAENRTTDKGKTMYEVNLHVRFAFYGANGDEVVASTWGEGTDMGDKATNKAMTMAFKNVLNQAFAISTEEFKDADAASPEETTRVPVVQNEAGTGAPTPKSWREIADRFGHLIGSENYGGWLREAIAARWDGKTWADLTKGEKQEAGQRTAGALIDLENEFAGDFPPPDRERIAKAFAKTWEGIALHGPPWYTGEGDPETLPTYDQWAESEQEGAGEPDEGGVAGEATES